MRRVFEKVIVSLSDRKLRVLLVTTRATFMLHGNNSAVFASHIVHPITANEIDSKIQETPSFSIHPLISIYIYASIVSKLHLIV